MPAEASVDVLAGYAPCYRGMRIIVIGADDVLIDPPGPLRVVTAGDLNIVDALGNQHMLAGLAAGADVVGPHGAAVAVQTVRGSSTVTQVLLGIF